MARFQMFDGDGNCLEGIEIDADSARDACRIFVARYEVPVTLRAQLFAYHTDDKAERAFDSRRYAPTIEDVQAVSVEVKNDSLLRSGKFWHGLPEHAPAGRITIDTIDFDDGCVDDRCSKYCKCGEHIPRTFVSRPMTEPERCGNCE